MWRVIVSRWVNHNLFGGRPDEMLSSRLYREGHYGWELTINLWWYWITGTKYHCWRTHRYEIQERRKDDRTKRASSETTEPRRQ